MFFVKKGIQQKTEGCLCYQRVNLLGIHVGFRRHKVLFFPQCPTATEANLLGVAQDASRSSYDAATES